MHHLRSTPIRAVGGSARSAWGEIFGDDMAATAMIDRLIHHSEILSLKGDSRRLRGEDHRRQTRRNRLTQTDASREAL